jgi:hypothetical protein
MAVRLKKTRMLDTYAALIENGQGEAETFFKAIEQYLKNANLPNVTFERTEVKTSRIWGRGMSREHILVSHKALPEFKMYIGARDYGNNLSITWALTIEVGFMDRQLSKQLVGSGVGLTLATLDLFHQQELDAYTKAVHRAVVRISQNLMKTLDQDINLLTTRTRSGLAAW